MKDRSPALDEWVPRRSGRLALAIFSGFFAAVAGASAEDSGLPAALGWRAGPPILAVDAARLPESPDNPWLAVKDPSVVRHGDRWHLFCTLRKRDGGDGKPPGYIRIGHLSFADWSEARSATWSVLDLGSLDYHGAPQVFFFEPSRTWYLVYQLADSARGIAYGPCFSTTTTLEDPKSWSLPQPFYAEKPSNLKGWIDFWVIGDAEKAHLFFTSNNGKLWRAETALARFPRGFGTPELALEGDFFEASHTYRLRNGAGYLTLIEAQGESGGRGRRYFQAYTADRLEGPWRAWLGSGRTPFAGGANVVFEGEAWTDSISHGELIRSGIDQRLEIDPGKLTFLYQGLRDDQWSKGYGKLPWRLGLLEAAGP
ncbi:MAG: glycoside hydrolase [Verrucomicrobiae bacterium]|nr:glycoside hydrolase [Verrucomicrobiae bacterium]